MPKQKKKNLRLRERIVYVVIWNEEVRFVTDEPWMLVTYLNHWAERLQCDVQVYWDRTKPRYETAPKMAGDFVEFLKQHEPEKLYFTPTRMFVHFDADSTPDFEVQITPHGAFKR
jgi:hypothetical protein